MTTLDPAARRALRARAHHLHPVVSIGQHGLTPAVLREIDIALKAHELIKVRVFGDDRDAREALLAEICAATEAAPVQHLGKLLVIWRPDPDAEKKAAPAPRARPAKKTPAKKAPAAKTPTRRRRDAPPAGVPRAALPRRRRARG
jgi:putative YhbY family RNA-binding protein